MHDDEIPTRPPTLDDGAGPPTEPPADEAPTPEPAPSPIDARKWVGAAIGVVAIALAALVGTGVIGTDVSAGERGPGRFGGNGGPPGFTGGAPGQLPGGGLTGPGGFPGQPVPSTTTLPAGSTS